MGTMKGAWMSEHESRFCVGRLEVLPDGRVIHYDYVKDEINEYPPVGPYTFDYTKHNESDDS